MSGCVVYLFDFFMILFPEDIGAGEEGGQKASVQTKGEQEGGPKHP